MYCVKHSQGGISFLIHICKMYMLFVVSSGKLGSLHCDLIFTDEESCKILVDAQSRSSPFVTQLDPIQERALDSALRNRFTVIRGCPGSGKTTICVRLAQLFVEANRGVPPLAAGPKKGLKPQVLICAPNDRSLDVIASECASVIHVNEKSPEAATHYANYDMLNFIFYFKFYTPLTCLFSSPNPDIIPCALQYCHSPPYFILLVLKVHSV